LILSFGGHCSALQSSHGGNSNVLLSRFQCAGVKLEL
jgi:hypothetical protein